MCLALWNRCPRGYTDLRESGFLVQPSGRLLQYYNNTVHQRPGINEELLKWMVKAAVEKGLTPSQCFGGIAFDEMKIKVCTPHATSN
jgi:hypothetical protein